MRTNFPVMFILVGYLPIPKHLGEMKTKPMQHAINALGQHNILPNLVVARAETEIDDIRKQKIALSCGIKKEQVISNPDVDNVYKIPLILNKQNVCQRVLEHFALPFKEDNSKLSVWLEYIKKISDCKTTVRVGIVGKYFDIGDFSLADSYISVIEAVKHAAWDNNCKPEIIWIDSKKYEDKPESINELNKIDCVIVPGGFGMSGIEGKIMTAKYCRENNIPYLGLCLGLQIAVIEFARNVCNLKDANSSEFNPKTKHPVINLLPEQIEKMKKLQYGASMRLGSQNVKIVPGSRAAQIYKENLIKERFRHRYEVNPEFVDMLKKKGLVFSGMTPDEKIMQIIELLNHRFFMASQFHPEFTSGPMRPNPLFNELIRSALNRVQKHLT